MAFAPALRRFTFTTHVTSSVGWVGAVLVFLALAVIGLTSPDERTVRGAYLVMAPAAWFVLVPLAAGRQAHDRHCCQDHLNSQPASAKIDLHVRTPWCLFTKNAS
jgi:hypothetical protein